MQVHAYGAIYSAPGLTLLQKQFLTIAFLERPCLVTCIIMTLLLPLPARMTLCFAKDASRQRHLPQLTHAES